MHPFILTVHTHVHCLRIERCYNTELKFNINSRFFPTSDTLYILELFIPMALGLIDFSSFKQQYNI